MAVEFTLIAKFAQPYGVGEVSERRNWCLREMIIRTYRIAQDYVATPS
jgi:hypothetical protein